MELRLHTVAQLVERVDRVAEKLLVDLELDVDVMLAHVRGKLVSRQADLLERLLHLLFVDGNLGDVEPSVESFRGAEQQPRSPATATAVANSRFATTGGRPLPPPQLRRKKPVNMSPKFPVQP